MPDIARAARIAAAALRQIEESLQGVPGVDEVLCVTEPDDESDPLYFEPYLFINILDLHILIQFSAEEEALLLKRAGGAAIACFAMPPESHAWLLGRDVLEWMDNNLGSLFRRVRWPSLSDLIRGSGSTSSKSMVFATEARRDA
jgi:hypothetical protein